MKRRILKQALLLYAGVLALGAILGALHGMIVMGDIIGGFVGFMFGGTLGFFVAIFPAALLCRKDIDLAFVVLVIVTSVTTIGASILSRQDDIFIAPIIAIVALLTTTVYLAKTLPDKLVPEGCCANCGYNLTGNVSGVCPECGLSISETDQ